FLLTVWLDIRVRKSWRRERLSARKYRLWQARGNLQGQLALRVLRRFGEATMTSGRIPGGIKLLAIASTAISARAQSYFLRHRFSSPADCQLQESGRCRAVPA